MNDLKRDKEIKVILEIVKKSTDDITMESVLDKCVRQHWKRLFGTENVYKI